MTRVPSAAPAVEAADSSALSRLVEGLPAAIYSCDAEGRITFFNAAAARLWGREPVPGEDRWCGSWRIHDAVDGTHIPHDSCPMALAVREGRSYRDVEARLLREDGSSIVASINIDPLRDTAGRIVGAVNVFFDISGRKRSEEALSDSERRFRLLADQAPVLIWISDENKDGVYYNTPWLEFTGRTLEEQRGEGWFASVHPEDLERVERICGDAFAAQRPFRLQFRMRRADGQWRWLLDSGTPRHEADGRFCGFIGTCIDITERMESEESLRFLSQASGVLARSIDYDATLAAVVELAVPRLADWCLVELLDVDGALETAAAAHRDPGLNELVGSIRRRGAERLRGARGAPRVVRSGEPELYHHIPEHLFAEVADDGELLANLEPRSAMVVPLTARGRVFGAWTLVSCEPGRYDARDLTLAEDLASRCAAAIDNAKLYAEAQHEIALRRSTERQLRRSREKLRFALDAAGAVTWEWDIARGLLRRSDNRADVYGRLSEAFDGTLDGFLRQVHPGDREKVRHRMDEAITTGEPYHAEFRLDTGEEPPRWLEAKGQVVYDAAGKAVRMVGISTRISERKQAEQELYRREQEFRVLVEHSPDIVARFDRELRHLYVNPAIVEAAGVRPDELIGRTSRELGMPAEICDRWEEALRTVFETGAPHSVEYSFPAPGGTRHYYSRIVPEFTEEGRVATVLGVTRDITQRRMAEQQIRSMNERLEQRVAERTAQLRRLTRQLALAEQQERRRLSHLLHDGLQQLLVAASMRIGLLDRRLGDGDGDAQAIAREVRELILQSIDLSRSLTQELSPPVLHDGGLAAALPWLAGLMEQRHGMQVRVELDGEAEAHDEETRVVLFSAARELLFNVVKHARTAEAELCLRREEDGWLRLTVEDRGAGFEPGEQHGNEFGLFGLRERVQHLGGRLVVTSARGEGTRVDLEIPCRRAGEQRRAAPELDEPPAVAEVRALQEAGAIRVLLADDHQILRDGVASILTELPDLEVVGEAADGREAVELALEIRPDVVIMDITMPRLSGIEATRIIRSRLPEVVVVGLSMHNSPDVAREMMEAGAFEVLVKDGPFEALLEAIRRACPRREPSAASSPHASLAPGDGA